MADAPPPAERASRRAASRLGRRLSRRLSLVTRVPSLLTAKLSSSSSGKEKHGNPPRTFDITIIAPDKTQRILSATCPLSVEDLIAPLVSEFELTTTSRRLRLAGSQASVDPRVDVSLLEGDVLLVDHPWTDSDKAETDVRLRVTERLWYGEKEFAAELGSASELWGGPLRKLACLLDDQHAAVFGGLAALARGAQLFASQIGEVVEKWDPETSQVGPLFGPDLWDNFEDYQDKYRRARQTLREKTANDEEFVEFCKLRRGAAIHTIESLLELPKGSVDWNQLHQVLPKMKSKKIIISPLPPRFDDQQANVRTNIENLHLKRMNFSRYQNVQRLAQYEQYFQDYLENTRTDHPDHEHLSRASTKAKQALKRGQEESDLERIQDLFPNDCLRLYDKDVLTMKMKGLIRKRSTTAARLQRALSAKSPRSDATSPATPAVAKDKRQFLMEAPVTFTTGVQSQERHLFLFNDLLLVAKARSGGNFKLKDKVRVSEMWLTRCNIEDVIEVHKSVETSFVVGWPTTNVVATFTTQAARDLWWNKLNEVVDVERDKEPRSTNIQVVYYDLATSIEYVKTFSVSPEETARACIRLALQHLEMRGLDPEDFQLWAKTSRDEAPYPLIGHERPFSIKLSCLRDGLSAEEGFDLDHCNNVHGPDPLAKCQFILRSKRKLPEVIPTSESKKNNKKNRKSPMRIRQVFRRSMSKGEDCVDGPLGALFGHPLSKLYVAEALPRPVMAMLQQVFVKGPFTQGIFRKSANARLVRELRDKLDAGEELRLEHVPVLVVAALLKDFLRSLPDPLLCSTLYPLWMEALECPDEQEKLLRIKSVLDQLPKANLVMLSLFLCVLHHVARRSTQNLMTPANLGVCVGPSLLWAPSPAALTPASSRAVPVLVELLVSRVELLLGSHVPLLLGEPPAERQDSGAEESDSLHSGGLRRDDSSIDSLERELLEPCPPPRKDKMSLSRDSGLTMSDSQLYTPDEEESGSTSSGSGRALYPPAQPACYDIHQHNKVTSSYSVPAASSANTNHSNDSPQGSVPTTTREYVRVYGGWEERVQECCRNTTSEDSIYARPMQKIPQNQSPGVINPNFQRQDWFRQRSHLKRLNSGGTGSPASSKSNHQNSGSSSGSASSGVGGLHQHNYRSANTNTLIRRSASEESLLNDLSEPAGYEGENNLSIYKRPALHRKGRAPPPPPPLNSSPSSDPIYSSYSPATPITRSKSAHHLCSEPESQTHAYVLHDSSIADLSENGNGLQNSNCRITRNGHRKAARTSMEDWSRSRSTPHIPVLDEIDRSYDSSTLSDDDSTPHVSRSNSRGKDCAAANSAWENAYGSAPSELLVHAAPINIQEESSSDSEHPSKMGVVISTPSPSRRVSAPATACASSTPVDSTAPPLPPKRSSIDIKLRHLPPVHVETVSGSSSGKNSAAQSQVCYSSKDELMQWEPSESPKKGPECRGRLRHRDVANRASQRSKSLPPPPGEKVHKEDNLKNCEEDPENTLGLSWSVSQLRTLFTNGIQPPPYRPPPSVIPSYRAPITTYHLGDSSQSERYVVSRRLHLDTTSRLRMDSTDEEESYV